MITNFVILAMMTKFSAVDAPVRGARIQDAIVLAEVELSRQHIRPTRSIPIPTVCSVSQTWSGTNNSGAATVRFDFARDSSLVVIPVLVNDRGPYRFLLDTGANNTLLSTNLAEKLHIRGGKIGNLITPAGSLPVHVQRLVALEVGSVRIKNLEIAVTDFSLLATLEVDGILGGDYLKYFTVSIDYPKQLVRMELRPCHSSFGEECSDLMGTRDVCHGATTGWSR